MTKILISGGGTSEPIDDVRVLTNKSTGKTASSLCEYLKTYFDVTYLKSENVNYSSDVCQIDNFITFDDLDSKLKYHLESGCFDVLIHCAAVSDYSLMQIEVDGEICDRTGKLNSGKELTMKFKPNKKIIAQVKKYAKKNLFVVGFKLTSTNSIEERKAAITKVIDAGADVVIHNDISDINAQKHIYTIYSKTQEVLASGDTKTQMGNDLEKIIRGKR